jgi:hypothetical protein
LDDNSFKRIVYFASIYAVGVSALYLWGYWGTFHLNPLEFIGLSDIVSYALFPFFASSGLMMLMSFGVGRVQAYLNPRDANSQSKEWIFVERFLGRLMLLDFIVLVFMLVLIPEPVKWFALILPIGIASAVFAPHLMPDSVLRSLTTNIEIRNTMMAGAVIFALVAFAQGRDDGFLVLQGTAPMLVDAERSGLSLRSNLTYVGHISNLYVLFDSADNRLLLFNSSKIDPLVLVKNPNAGGGKGKASASQPTHGATSSMIPSPKVSGP